MRCALLLLCHDFRPYPYRGIIFLCELELDVNAICYLQYVAIYNYLFKLFFLLHSNILVCKNMIKLRRRRRN